MKKVTTLSIFLLHLFGVYGDSEWWQTSSLYQLCPRSFKDSDGDGIGDFKGIQSKLHYLVESGFNAFWLTPFYPSPLQDFGYDISNFREIDPVYGTMKDFEDLLELAHNLSVKVVIDFVPNHSSDQHEWFKKSIKKIDPYTNYYIWNEGKFVNDVRVPPNNWNSVFGGSSWTWNDERKEYYYHQFAKGQPDFNFRNNKVREEMKEILKFWINKGVDGFRMDALPFIFEDKYLRNEKLSGKTHNPTDYEYTFHDRTMHLIENYELVREWRDVIDTCNKSTIIMIEAYANITLTMLYYSYGAHYPFNFGFITGVHGRSNAKTIKYVIDEWFQYLPPGATSSWVAGNHDQPRLVSRFGRDIAPVITAIVQLLPGVAVTYIGEEICMENTFLTWEETRDPQGCNAGKDHYMYRSRDPFRTPFQWDTTTSAGFSTNQKTWLRVNDNYKIVNLLAQKTAENSCYKSFLNITMLRKWPAVSNGTLTTKLFDDNIFAFSRELKAERSVYLVANLHYKPVILNLNVFENISSKLELYHTTSNSDLAVGSIVYSNKIRIPARSARIFISTVK